VRSECDPDICVIGWDLAAKVLFCFVSSATLAAANQIISSAFVQAWKEALQAARYSTDEFALEP